MIGTFQIKDTAVNKTGKDFAPMESTQCKSDLKT